jgi:heme/copper-type cytochrome/quinol oxidase subunit 1
LSALTHSGELPLCYRLTVVLKNRFQQIVAVIGLGVGLWLVGTFVASLGALQSFGWVAYAPLSNSVAIPGRDLTSGEQWLVWLGLVAAWVVVSCLIFRDRPTSAPE